MVHIDPGIWDFMAHFKPALCDFSCCGTGTGSTKSHARVPDVASAELKSSALLNFALNLQNFPLSSDSKPTVGAETFSVELHVVLFGTEACNLASHLRG